MEGSGTDDGLPPTTGLLAETAVSSPPPLLKSVELMLPAPTVPLCVSDSARAKPLDKPRGLPVASLASIVTIAGLPAVPPILKAF